MVAMVMEMEMEMVHCRSADPVRGESSRIFHVRRAVVTR